MRAGVSFGRDFVGVENFEAAAAIAERSSGQSYRRIYMLRCLVSCVRKSPIVPEVAAGISLLMTGYATYKF